MKVIATAAAPRPSALRPGHRHRRLAVQFRPDSAQRRRQPAGPDIEAQTEQVFDNLSAVLAAAGASLAQVVKCTVFVKDLKDFGRLNSVFARASATTSRPARPSRWRACLAMSRSRSKSSPAWADCFFPIVRIGGAGRNEICHDRCQHW
jgi:enamine deaminase RidA (YjgF/YER057c/UK114 family)